MPLIGLAYQLDPLSLQARTNGGVGHAGNTSCRRCSRVIVIHTNTLQRFSKGSLVHCGVETLDRLSVGLIGIPDADRGIRRS